MLRRSTATVLAFAWGALSSVAGTAMAQDRPTSRPASRPSREEPVDETETAAELLKKLLGLKPVESRPTDTQRSVDVRPHPQDPHPTTKPEPGTTPEPEPGARPQEPQPQQPQQPTEPRVEDDTERAVAN